MGRTDPFIPIAKPLLAEEEIQAAARPITSGWVTQGPEVAAFEREFARKVGARHACAVSSCTAALHLALLAVGVKPGDEVITASHSFIASANAIRYCGALPVFVDVRRETYNLDPDLIQKVITERTRAILCIHQVGMPCDLGRVLGIARRNDLRLIEDAACAAGSQVRLGDRWEPIGRPHGDIACFSFHPRKVITTGDGGMLTTNNAEWDRVFRLWRQHSMGVPDAERHAAPKVIFETYAELGFNYRMTDIQAAVGREQLKRLPEIVARRRALAVRYKKLIAKIQGVCVQEEPAWARSNWQSFCVGLPEGHDQRRVMQLMLDAGVATRRGVMCAHREAAYPRGTWSCGVGAAGCHCAPGSCKLLARGEALQDRTIILPLFPQMTFEQQDRVVSTLNEALQA